MCDDDFEWRREWRLPVLIAALLIRDRDFHEKFALGAQLQKPLFPREMQK